MKPLFCFCGASGSGKTSLVETLCERYGLRKAQTTTDRPRRFPTETGYTFLTPEEYDKIPAEHFIEQTVFSGHRYGSTKEALDASDCIIMDLKGICAIKTLYARPIVAIGVHAAMVDIVARMRARGDSDDAIKIRLENDEVAFSGMLHCCDIIVNNADFETTISRLWAIIKNEKENV